MSRQPIRGNYYYLDRSKHGNSSRPSRDVLKSFLPEPIGTSRNHHYVLEAEFHSDIMVRTMRELHGVLDPSTLGDMAGLKCKALLFDKLHAVEVKQFLAGISTADPESSQIQEYEYLVSQEFLNNAEAGTMMSIALEKGFIDAEAAKTGTLKFAAGINGFIDLSIRCTVSTLTSQNIDAVPIFTGDTFLNSVEESAVDGFFALTYGKRAERTPFEINPSNNTNTALNIMSVALTALPSPGAQTSWQDIFDFRTEHHDKEWGFRRFLQTLATKPQTEVEILDNIEWAVNEYRKAMDIHGMKASNSFVEVFIISPLELVEDLVKVNWSKIAKGLLSVKKRQVELMEAEMKAPGKECAYVFEARKRFVQRRSPSVRKI